MLLTSELTQATFRASNSFDLRPPSLTDKIEVILLTALAEADIDLKRELLGAAKKFCDNLDKKQIAMSERQSRQDKGLLSILK